MFNILTCVTKRHICLLLDDVLKILPCVTHFCLILLFLVVSIVVEMLQKINVLIVFQMFVEICFALRDTFASAADGGIFVLHCLTLFIICCRWWDFYFILCNPFHYLLHIMWFLFYTAWHFSLSAADDGISVSYCVTLICYLLQMVGFLFYTVWHFSLSAADDGISVLYCVTLFIICCRWWNFCFTLLDTFHYLLQMMEYLFYTAWHFSSSAIDGGISVLHCMTLFIICCRWIYCHLR